VRSQPRPRIAAYITRGVGFLSTWLLYSIPPVTKRSVKHGGFITVANVLLNSINRAVTRRTLPAEAALTRRPTIRGR